ncbi:MAG: carbamoyl-phosphate synthase large subunit [Acidimicrobiales bacterium]
MPKRTDIESILIIGSGPIVIGQACEFDYSGTQACRVLREEGYRVILANSNPATIMTDPDFADATYVEPLVAEVLEKILDVERPDAVLPTLGGQTALNLAMELSESGALERRGIELIGADAEAIATAEDRERFKEAMIEIGLKVPPSGVAAPPAELKGAPKGDLVAAAMVEARRVVADIGLPVVIRPAYILGGKGTGIASTPEEFEKVASYGLDASPITEILIEKSIAGWKEYELEVMRDRADNCVIICSIENVDPMGVHTGDSITVAPAQTLSDVEYQAMRDAAFACLRRVGVETGGSNVQFALDPTNGDMVVIEMNPRVSRSSALASKATGFPIAKIAARLAVGYTLDEIPNDITKKTPASFEPTIDYVVTKVPRWAFEKFPGQRAVLGTQMQSVGEAMAIGRTFPESLQKALRSLEQGRYGLNCDPGEVAYDELSDDDLVAAASIGTPERPFQLEAAIRRGISLERIYEETKVDPWFLDQMSQITEERAALAEVGLAGMSPRAWKRAKRLGFGDAQLAHLWGTTEREVRSARLAAGVRATFKTVDTCGAEFEAETPYHYSTYEDEDEVRPSDRPKVLILGSGPNRIGQGIEFDYCCVHASFSLRDAGFETIMLNCNPETVSTDYDTSDRLYFEPLTYEDVMNVIEGEQASGDLRGVIVSLGGQTPLKLSGQIPQELVLGTSPRSIDLAEDREGWNALCAQLGIPQPPGGTATTFEAAQAIAAEVGYPVLVRPSYVLGGRAMEIVYDDEQLAAAMAQLAGFGSLGREGGLSAERPVLVDRFLEDATEVDVDAIRDATGDAIIGGVMEHVEEAGVHSGDSACAIPPYSLSAETVATIEAHTRAIAEALDVRGLINVQYAVRDGEVFVIEANPRASRTVPFVAKATGVPLVKVASRVMLGATLDELRAEGLLRPGSTDGHVAVKEAVLPFNRFPDADRVLGPEMRSTGEVMGIDRSFGLAFAKSQIAAGDRLPEGGRVFFSLADRDKPAGVRAAQRYHELGFELVATAGTADALEAAGVPVAQRLAKLGDDGAGGGGPTAGGPSSRPARSNWWSTARAAEAAGRRRLHPLRRGDRRDPMPHDRGRRPGRRRRHARLGHPRPAGEAAPGVPLIVGRRRIATIPALPTRVGSVELRNPVLTASGTSGHGAELAPYVDLAGLGAVVCKSVAADPWPGNPAPRVHEATAGMLNAVGLQGRGVAAWLADDLPPLLATGATVVASIWGRSVDDYRRAADLLADAPAGVVAVEVNLSCPNVEDRSGMFAHSAEATEVAMAATAGCGRPRWAKLSPNAGDIVPIVDAAMRGGAEAVTLVNTVMGMAIDPATRTYRLGNGGGGLSGPAIHPVAVRIVHDVAAARPAVPIVGVGGVTDAEGAAELLVAGAAAVQVGTATFADPRAPGQVAAGLVDWCRRHGIPDVAELIGAMHGHDRGR